MVKILIHFTHFFQTILFFLFESVISSMFLLLIWNLILQKHFTFQLSFIDIIACVFSFKIVTNNILNIIFQLDREAEYESYLKNKNA
jgi:hypothetical protein